ncbi:group III truncated hemoglobin [Flavobacterium sp. GT3R68]|uniref:group III truncated hemoglobin n=1 Tax=Flavobacterium sp. GT3R68 TaxID=2594437 RepID=UPI000F872C47|nr:group III truncated hemoglobin [Flavobacterium sp. GT3R68]RTY90233.1 group III truncated hemoglobin [Flavobacterium sp. GSN2]TRW90534.1 group III truncated hemoglobin [Flavobacterium sp. GT3R68]
MNTPKDISNLDDIKLLVDTFYSEVRKDNLIGSIFNEKIGNQWPEHLGRMYRFWQTILLEEHTYSGSPFPPHAHLPIGKEHFSRWMEIFIITVNRLFEGPLAEDAKMRAEKMAEMFHYKIEYFRNTGKKPLL